mgnify:CR=1 FL=1
MAVPAWVPPALPSIEEPASPERSNNRAALVIAIAAAALVGMIGAAAWQYRPAATSTEAAEAMELVDELLTEMGAGSWEEAVDRFGSDCIDVEAAAFQSGFSPVMEPYEGHGLVQLRATTFETGQIVLVRGWVDLGGLSDHPVRAELVYGEASPPWKLCGLRIDQP